MQPKKIHTKNWAPPKKLLPSKLRGRQMGKQKATCDTKSIFFPIIENKNLRTLFNFPKKIKETINLLACLSASIISVFEISRRL